MDTELKLNPDIDASTYTSSLQQHGRVQVENILDESSADYLYQLLLDHQHWYLAYNEGKNYYESSMEQLQVLGPEQRQQFMNEIYARARTQFQYVFNQYYITQAIEKGEDSGHPMHRVHHFINSDEVIAFMRSLTGNDEVRKADSYATLYSPGQFLTRHDDSHYSHDRVAAYTIGMTKNWEADWGGYTAFFDDRGDITQAFKPAFNVLTVFLIPQPHAVQLVSPFAGNNRTSYIGWLQK